MTRGMRQCDECGEECDDTRVGIVYGEPRDLCDDCFDYLNENTQIVENPWP